MYYKNMFETTINTVSISIRPLIKVANVINYCTNNYFMILSFLKGSIRRII